MKFFRYIYSFLVCASFLLLVACSKDGGYHDLRVSEKSFNGDTYEYLKSKPGVFDSLVAVIDRVGLEKTLRDGNITLFALDNQSFRLAIGNLNYIRKLGDKPPVYIANVKYKHLDTMMTQYIIQGIYPTDSLDNQDGLKVFGVKYGYPMHASLDKTPSSGYVAGGPSIIDLHDTKRSPFNYKWAEAATSSVNIKTSNGLVHILNPDHIFGFNDFVYRMTFIPPPLNLFKSIGGVGIVQPGKEATNEVEKSPAAFDGVLETKFLKYGTGGSVWLQFEFTEPALANSYTFTTANGNANRHPADWVLEASQDGEEWIVLDARTDEVFEDRWLTRVFRMRNATAYKFYRVNILRTRSNDLEISDWTVNFESGDE